MQEERRTSSCALSPLRSNTLQRVREHYPARGPTQETLLFEYPSDACPEKRVDMERAWTES